MIEEIISHKYAKAVFDIAEEKNRFDEFERQLNAVSAIFEKQKNLFLILGHPAISYVKKTKLAEELFKNLRISDEIKKLILISIHKKRLKNLKDIIVIYRNLTLFMQKRTKVQVESAYSLTSEQKDNLRHRLSKMLDKDVALRLHVDPHLLGGLRVKIGSLVYDYSLKRIMKAMIC